MSSHSIRILGFLLRFVVLGLAIAFVVRWVAPSWLAKWQERSTSNQTSAAQAPLAGSPSINGPFSYNSAVARAAPAVVSIYANKITTVRQYRIVPDPITRRLFGAIAAGPAYRKKEHSLGSGVVFSADGYVLTNNHVIDGADDIQVLLSDGRVAQAHIIGADADTDLAVLKIEAADLPTIAIADQGEASVGDVVLAIGNPFGVGKTVTMGIVSATGRQLRLSAYEDFIQTDAAINFGNSGGALVNARGELVGINTAVYRSAGNGGGSTSTQQDAEGIGFAIPVATAKAVLDQIIKHGMVVRGWLGAEYADLDAVTPRDPDVQKGAIVLGVLPGGPADQAGIGRGDVLLRLNGEEIDSQADLRSLEAALAPGSAARIDGVRSGSSFSVQVQVMQRPSRTSTSG